jgi:hypothetical protein
MTTETSREKRREQDHDLLIRLDVKVTDIASDIKDLKDGLSARMSEAESRISVLEDRTKVINPEILPKDLEKIKILENNARIFFWLVAPIYLGIIGYAVSRFVALF